MTIERIIPLLTYEDIAAAHDFLVGAFGFSSGGVHRTSEGKAVHGEVRAGSAAIWLHHVGSGLNSPAPSTRRRQAWSCTRRSSCK